MQKESLVLHNPNHEIISFRLDKGVDDNIAKMSRHKQRRLIRCFSYNVALPSRQSVDLVKLSGLTVKEIKESTEYLQMQNHFQVLYDSSLVTEPVEEVEDVDPIDAEDIDGILIEDQAETLDEIFEEELIGGIEIKGTTYNGEQAGEVEIRPELESKEVDSGVSVIPAQRDEVCDQEEYPDSVIGFEEIVPEPERIDLEVGKPVFHSVSVVDPEQVLDPLTSIKDVEPEPEPEPEIVEEVKPEPKKKAAPKKRKPRKKATKKKTAKRGSK